MQIRCPICGDNNAGCNWSADSDGAAWTWITWSHYCAHCGYSVRKMTQDAYNHEDVQNCPIPGHMPALPERTHGGLNVVHALNTDINKPTELSNQIRELQEHLRELEDFESRSLRAGGVFISYSHNDKDFVDRLVSCLERDGINLWRDEKEILVGEVIDKAISEGIQKNWLFIVVLTPASINSRWVQREFDEASHEEIEGNKTILPIVACGLRIEDVPPRVRRKFCAMFSGDFDSAYNSLRKSIVEHLKRYQRSVSKG